MADTKLYSRNEFRFAIAEESTFGTAITAQGEFREIYITDTPQIDWGGIIRDEVKRADGKRVMSHTDVYQATAGGTYTCSVSGILTDTTADLLLYGAMQDLVSEAAGSPFLKTYEWDGSTTGVSGATPNKFFTINGYNPDTSEHWLLKSCVLSSLSISADPGSNGGRATFSATFWTGFPPVISGLTVTPASWTAIANDFYVFQSLNTKTVAGSDVVLGSFSLNFENNVVRVGHDSSGDPQQYTFPNFNCTGEVSVKFDDNSAPEIDKWVLNPTAGSAESEIILQWGDGSADGTLKFLVNAIYTGHSYDFGNDAGVFVSLPFQGVDDGSNEAVEVLLANAADRSW
tara:strand:+ start:565 stop:1596 length:1032 start_codon:yes stop_codon:yes gene_type:complete